MELIPSKRWVLFPWSALSQKHWTNWAQLWRYRLSSTHQVHTTTHCGFYKEQHWTPHLPRAALPLRLWGEPGAQFNMRNGLRFFFVQYRLQQLHKMYSLIGIRSKLTDTFFDPMNEILSSPRLLVGFVLLDLWLYMYVL